MAKRPTTQVRTLPRPPEWQTRVKFHDQDAPLMPLPLQGPSPTFRARTQAFVGMPQRPFKPERLIVSKIGPGRVTGQLFVGPNLLTAVDPVDLELIGSPNSFSPAFNIPMVEPGTQIRLLVTWHPAPSACRMSIEEFERRSNENDWTSTVEIDGERYRLTIDPAKVRLVMVDAKTHRKLARQRLTRDFSPYMKFNAMVLGRIIL